MTKQKGLRPNADTVVVTYFNDPDGYTQNFLALRDKNGKCKFLGEPISNELFELLKQELGSHNILPDWGFSKNHYSTTFMPYIEGYKNSAKWRKKVWSGEFDNNKDYTPKEEN